MRETGMTMKSRRLSVGLSLLFFTILILLPGLLFPGHDAQWLFQAVSAACAAFGVLLGPKLWNRLSGQMTYSKTITIIGVTVGLCLVDLVTARWQARIVGWMIEQHEGRSDSMLFTLMNLLVAGLPSGTAAAGVSICLARD
jgi:uncharacterized membrane protein YfcA